MTKNGQTKGVNEKALPPVEKKIPCRTLPAGDYIEENNLHYLMITFLPSMM
jgi:hypothetical protein